MNIMASEFLTIKLEDVELYDEETSTFITRPGKEVVFRYTLRNLDKWETKHEKRFIDNFDNISPEEILDFIQCICDESIDLNVLTQKDYDQIIEYLKHTPSATTMPNKSGSAVSGFSRKKIFTSEIIYAHMALNHIPFSWEDRNLNKLIMLLNCVGSLQEPPKKMTRAEALEEQRRVIMERRRLQEQKEK